MRNKFVSLILGLLVILIAPVFTTSCVKETKKEKKECVSLETPVDVQLIDIAPGQKVSYAGVFAFAQDDLAGSVNDGAADSTASDAEILEDNGLFGWQNILIAVLSILSVLFGALWKRARSAIAAINEALQDGSVSKAELAKIVAAWKGY